MAKGPRTETAGAAAKTSKYDVELAQAQVALEHAKNKGLAQRSLAKGIAWGIAILAFGVAIGLAKGVVHEIAGKKTVIDADVVMQIGLVVSLTINVAQFTNGHTRKRTIQRQRKRSDVLEQQLGIEIEID
jgi:hypothetical protein